MKQWICLIILLSICLSAVAAAEAEQLAVRTIAITIDDLPAQRGNLKQMQSITERILNTLTENQIQAVGFAVEEKVHRLGEVDERTDLLRQWLQAGQELGNHTYSHPCDHSLPIAAYEEDVVRGETILKSLLEESDRQLRYFRHPCLFTGPTPEYKQELDRFLKERGYTIGVVTVDNSEWMLGAVYSRAKQNGDSLLMRRIKKAYIPHLETMVEFFETMSRDLLGYELPQIMLLHANELTAEMLDDVIEMLRTRGYSFVTLETALQDPAYQLPEGHFKNGVSWLHRWRKAAGLEFQREPDVPAFVEELYESSYR